MLGLSLKGLVEQFAAEGIAELDHEFFEIGEGGAPGWSLRSVEVMHQVFGGGQEDRAQISGNIYGVCR